MANCVKCGAPLKAKNQFCTKCGEGVSNIANAALPTPPQVSAQCPKCGAASPAGKRFCTKCGTTLSPSQQAQTFTGEPCPKCGAAVPAGKRFCTQCGHTLSPAQQTSAATGPAAQSNIPLKQSTVADVKCDSCGATVPADKRFCTTCGKPIGEKPAPVIGPPPPFPPVIEATPQGGKLVEVTPQPPKAPPLPAKSPGRSSLLRIGLPIVAVVVIAAGLFAVYSLFIRKPAILNDKQLLVTYYGPPPFFTVIIAKDESQQPPKPVRREVWVYPDRKASFVFLGEKYQFSSDLKSFGKSVAKAASNLRIERITESLTIDDLSKLVGNKPVSVVDLPKEELPDAIRYEYGGGIKAVFSRGRLLMVQVMPAQEGK